MMNSHGMEKKRTPVGRPDFKSGGRRQTSPVGSTPTLFRHKRGGHARRRIASRAPSRGTTVPMIAAPS